MLSIGQQLQERYQITAKLGEGGMGAVYRAYDNRLNKECVVKVMLNTLELMAGSTAAADQFKREAQVLANLDHPCLPRVTDYFTDRDSNYLVMDLVEGQSLLRLIGSQGLPEAMVLNYARPLLDVLAYIHSKGVVHRDIKPANIIIKPDGRPVLVDFGLVKVISPGGAGTMTIWRGVGTPEYAPPEQLKGGTDQRSDLYSLGATLYHALTGQPPLDATDRSIKDLPGIRKINPSVSTRTERVILRALMLKPDLRYASAAAMRAELDGRFAPAPLTPAPAPKIPKTRVIPRDEEGHPATPAAAPAQNEVARPKLLTRISASVGSILSTGSASLLDAQKKWQAQQEVKRREADVRSRILTQQRQQAAAAEQARREAQRLADAEHKRLQAEQRKITEATRQANLNAERIAAEERKRKQAEERQKAAAIQQAQQETQRKATAERKQLRELDQKQSAAARQAQREAERMASDERRRLQAEARQRKQPDAQRVRDMMMRAMPYALVALVGLALVWLITWFIAQPLETTSAALPVDDATPQALSSVTQASVVNADEDPTAVNRETTPIAPTPVPLIATATPTIEVANEITITLPGGIPMVLVRIPAGEFTMGIHNPHKVMLEEYWIGKYEVSYKQYKAYLSDTQTDSPLLRSPVGDDLPVTSIYYSEAVEFCVWLSRLTGFQIRLPTGEQWEKAARGTDARIYPWGNETPTCAYLNYWDCPGRAVKSVYDYKKDVSPYGIINMAANVSEWNRDISNVGYVYSRGASYLSLANGLSVTSQNQHFLNTKDYLVGFRVSGYIKPVYTNKPATTHSGVNAPSTKITYTANDRSSVIITLSANVTMTLVRVTSGSFIMGNDRNSDIAFYDEHPQHKVFLSDYWIGKTEVTNGQFMEFVNSTGHQTTAELLGYSIVEGNIGFGRKDVEGADWKHPTGPSSSIMGYENYPVVHVSWRDAIAFCEWISDMSGLTVHLPSEAEWEKAARGPADLGGPRTYPWGDDLPNNKLANISGSRTSEQSALAPVGSYPQGASPYGVLDLSGNASEWTSSLYRPYPYDAADGRENQESYGYRAARGGSYLYVGVEYLSSTYRGVYLRHSGGQFLANLYSSLYPDKTDNQRGFRVAASFSSISTRVTTTPTATQAIATPAPTSTTLLVKTTPVPNTVTPLPPTPTNAVVTPESIKPPVHGNEMVLTLAPNVTMVLVRVPAGSFLMGSADSDTQAGSDEKPQHRVTLSEYWIGKYEVTNAQFAVYAQAKAINWAIPPGKDNHPVTGVNWDLAMTFCSWLSEVSNMVIRLPTEAEWEKAARGTDSRSYPWGNTAPSCQLANFSGCDNTTAVVGSRIAGASPFGVLDMAGNAEEWTLDWYDMNYYSVASASNPRGPSSGTYHVLRGGSWVFDQNLLRATTRGWGGPIDRLGASGIRVVSASVPVP